MNSPSAMDWSHVLGPHKCGLSGHFGLWLRAPQLDRYMARPALMAEFRVSCTLVSPTVEGVMGVISRCFVQTPMQSSLLEACMREQGRTAEISKHRALPLAAELTDTWG